MLYLPLHTTYDNCGIQEQRIFNNASYFALIPVIEKNKTGTQKIIKAKSKAITENNLPPLSL